MSGFAVKLLTGVAELLDVAGVGDWTAAGVSDGTGVAIVLTDLPQTPDKIICLTHYDVLAHPSLTDSIQGVQVRVRGDRDPRTSLDIMDAVYDALHALTHVTLGTAPDDVQVGQILWQSSAALGPDANGRYERSSNYYLNVNRALSTSSRLI